MSRTAVKSKLKTFHATMHVLRAEGWCVEAATPEEARQLFAAGQGHRCTPGECVSVDLHSIHED